MYFNLLVFLLMRVVLPCLLMFAIFIRPVILSGFYLLAFFASPFVPLFTKVTSMKYATVYFSLLLAISFLMILCQTCFFAIGVVAENEILFGPCSYTEALLRHLGFISGYNSGVVVIIHWLAPDIIVFLIAMANFGIMRMRLRKIELKFGESTMTQSSTDDTITLESDTYISEYFRKPSLQLDESTTFMAFLISKSPFICMMGFLLAGVLRPSILGFFYYFIFLCLGTYMACYHDVEKKFCKFLRFVLFVLAIHITMLLAYQMPWVQERFMENAFSSRLMGFSPLLRSTCEVDLRIIVFQTDNYLDSYFNIFVLNITYILTALTVLWLPPYIDAKKEYERLQTEKMESRKSSNTPPTLTENILFGIWSIANFIYTQSYIFMNGIMMVWAIVYHSWLTFILLLWANFLWILPDQRKAMKVCVILIVGYGEILILIQYLYSLDLTEEELPATYSASGVNLHQIGFYRPQDSGAPPSFPLLMKTLFLFAFWITLRSFSKEKALAKRGSARASTLGFFSFRKNSLSNVASFRKARIAQASVVRKFGVWLSNFIIRLWLWGLIFFILILVITGTHVTVFRTCYMGLVLFFVIIFQISTTSWLRIMYGFWLFMIFYSMTMLILIYTYQFDKFDVYWESHFSLPKQLQDDIGFERYKIKDLFLQLLSPTCIIIMTVIQVQHFHRRLIVSIQSSNLGTSSEEEHVPPPPETPPKKIRKRIYKVIAEIIVNCIQFVYLATTKILKRNKSTLWNLLEYHWIKVVYISAFVSSVNDISIMHLPIIILCLIGVMVENNLRTFLIPIITIFISLVILSKMVYQLGYLDHASFDVYCAKFNETYNNAVWFGLNKKPDETGLLDYLSIYVIYILISSLHALILMRQRMLRRIFNEPIYAKNRVLFPEINRDSAEKDLEGLVKFLLNYGFYKFGYEICLILIIATISYRDDIVAVAYSVWLVLLLSLKRPKVIKIWKVLRVFTIISILLQFLILVFFPRSFCVYFPWYNSIYSDALQRWGLLPGYMLTDFSKKLTWEYIVMITIHHQYWNFKYESVPNYPGGSNLSVTVETKKLKKNFVNPTHDFLSNTRNSSDYIKYFVIPGFYWLTLAVIFIAGAHINDVLAIGYFVGAFIFLWEGSDFYIRPIQSIRTRWFALIIFCVINVVARRSLQLIGCLFINFLTKYCCWLVHLFGINCSISTFLMSADMETIQGEGSCPVVTVEVEVVWDAICFSFLIIQYRIFCSYYFLHIVNDTKASYILASRGASIIERLRLRELKLRLDREKLVLNKIKAKMDKLRSAQQKNADEKAAALAERGFQSNDQKSKALLTHPNAVRSGDYYMFDEEDEKFELEMIPQTDNLFQGGSVEPTRSELRILKMRVAKPRLERSGVNESSGASSRYLQYEQTEALAEAEPQKVKNANPVKRLLTNFLVLLTVRLNRISHNYRYVNKILTAEKRALKDLEQIAGTEIPADYRATQMKKLQGIITELETSRKDYNIFVEFSIAMGYLLLSNTELVCYVMVFAHKIINYGAFSLPLPLLVFLWGTLSVPRPTKTFWISLITYSMAIVILKCVMQFDFVWGRGNLNSPNESSFDMTDLTGISNDRNYATSDLCLLLSLFIHRYMLKWYGLWKVDEKHEKTIHRSLFHEFEEKILRRDDRRKRKAKSPDRSKSPAKSELSLAKHSELPEDGTRSEKKKYSKGFKKFFDKLLNKARLPVDVYALMFICDFINFFVLFFGFNAFGKSKIDDDSSEDAVKSVLSENRVPVPFLIMLFVQFILIVIDRVLYLRKALKSKICFHCFSVIGTHVWMFIIVPKVTDAPFADSVPPVVFYVVKCIYLLLSAYQIRCGYPKRILGNFITRGFSLINMVAFNIYRQIPFLYELRTILDWLCTDTTMSLFEWMKMEDIFSKIYSLRCIREYEADFPSPRGIKKEIRSKLILGGLFFVILVGLIWAPLSLFALFNAVGVPNIPNEVSFSIRLGSYDPIYSVRSRENIIVFTEKMFDTMKEVYEDNKLAQAFLLNYDAADIAAIKLSGNSPSMWNIAPPDREKLVNTLKLNTSVTIRLTYKLERKSDADYASAVVDSEISFEMNSTYPHRHKLISMLEGNVTNTDLIIPDFVPKFIKITSSSHPTYISALMMGDTTRSLMLNIRNDVKRGGPSWWEISDTCDDDDISMALQRLPFFACDSGVVIYTFNEKKFPSTLRILTAKGIMGLYTTFVLLASRIIRSIASDYSSKIINDELPNVDRILQLCLDIYLVREAMEFILEEDLFSKLIFLYRSPETMIKWTRPPEPELEPLPPPPPPPPEPDPEPDPEPEPLPETHKVEKK